MFTLILILTAAAVMALGIPRALTCATRHRADATPPPAPADTELDDWRGTGGHPLISEHRADLDGHTITVERTADGERVVVERGNGKKDKLVRFESELAPGETIYMAARAAAGTYKATYVPDLTARSSSDRHEVAVDNILGGGR